MIECHELISKLTKSLRITSGVVVIIVGGSLFLIFLTEQVGMCACIKHDEDKFLVVLLPDEEPVGLDVALPLALAVVVQLMNAMFWVKRLSVQQFSDDCP